MFETTFETIQNYLNQKTAMSNFFKKDRVIEVPLLRDIYGLTALDIILGIRQDEVRLGLKSR